MIFYNYITHYILNAPSITYASCYCVVIDISNDDRWQSTYFDHRQYYLGGGRLGEGGSQG